MQTFQAPPHPIFVIIVLTTLVIRDGRSVVYALDSENRVRVRNVDTGLRGSKLVEVRSGLQPGDRVILGAQAQYADDQRVTPLPIEEPASECVNEAGSVIDLQGDQAQSSGGEK